MSARLILLLIAGAIAALALWRFADLVATARVSKATDTFNQENRDAADAISAARARVRDCHARGLSWDRAAGQCVGPVPRPGK
jgi:hypothetical protein